MKKSELDRMKAISETLKPISCGNINQRKQALPSVVDGLKGKHGISGNENMIAIELFQYCYSMLCEAADSGYLKLQVNNLKQALANKKTPDSEHLYKEINQLEKEKKSLESRFHAKCLDFNSIKNNIKAKEKELSIMKERYASNKTLRDENETLKKSLDNLTAEFGRLKRKIEKGRI